MNEIANVETISRETALHVLGTGDLAKLSPTQRVEYMLRVCTTVGLNPLTRPFRFLTFQGQTTLYATRDCTDQLRQARRISVTIVDKRLDGDLYVVTARAKTADGREDEDIGAVTLGQLKGDARANALMKALTKAKRRVTLSVCGLGFMDETEAETLVAQGATTFDAEMQPPATIEAERPQYPFATAKGGTIYRTSAEWIERWRRLEEACRLTEALDKLKVAAEMNAKEIEEVATFDAQAAGEVRDIISAALEPPAPKTETKAAEPAAEPQDEMALP